VSPRRFGLAPALVAIAVVLGCRTPPPISDYTAGVPLAIDDARAEEILERYLAASEARFALQGLARVDLDGPDFKLNRPQRIVVERPARLRFEVLGLFDQLAGLLVTNGRDFAFFDASSGEITRGPMRPRLLWELARIDLDAPEVVGILLGVPTPSLGTARAAVWLESNGDLAVAFAWPGRRTRAAPGCVGDARAGSLDPACFLTFASLAEGGEVFFFDERGRLHELRWLEPGGAVRFRALFEDYEPLEAPGGRRAAQAGAVAGPGESGKDPAPVVEFARQVTIRSPQIDSQARFHWKRVRLSSGVSDRIFEIPGSGAAE
jgi:hypothetical protein